MKKRAVSVPMARREFLRISSTAVVGLAAASLIEPQSLFAGSSNLPLLSIGYANALPGAGHSISLGAASSLLTSDPGFLSRGARVSVVASNRAEQHAERLGGVQVDAIFPVRSRTPETYPRFGFWSFNNRRDVPSEGGPVTFTMPVTSTGGLQFLVHRLKAEAKSTDPEKAIAPDADERNVVTLGVSSGGDAMLQRGVYIFAFREAGNDREPNWSRLTLSNEDGALTVPNLAASYMVLVVDYNKE